MTTSSAAAASFPCAQCGADTAFDPATSCLACAHCGHRAPVARGAAPIVERDFRAAMAAAARRPATELGGTEVECRACGARVVVAGHAGRCAFCDSALVVAVERSDDIVLPESLLPFAVDRATATGAFATWLGERWFAPRDLVARARKDGLDGVYLPHWTFDSETSTDYTGQRGDDYTETEHYTDSQGKRQTRQVKKTRWSSASGTVRVDFDDVLVCASTSLPDRLVVGLEPWDLDALVPFDGRYLAGFVAERYRIDLDDGFRRAEDRMEPAIERAIRRDIGGDHQRISSKDVSHRDVSFKHVLLPLWISSYRYRDRVYRVTVNARTGEVSGERPWSALKIGLLVLLIAAVVATAAYVIYRATEQRRADEQQQFVG